MKFIAFYLPQYHTIPENDMWWGKGFTEWERVKNAKPLFENHNQPRIPYEYYDLSDINVMKNQAHLAKEFGIYGFCYYHYWFNGKLLLEKPLEQMLNSQSVDIQFCLCWANEKWTRAWDGKSREILIEQGYGREKEWEENLKYLMPYFFDKRYIRIDGKPVFLIYRTESFNGFGEMISYWNNSLTQKGLNTLFIIEMFTSFQKKPMCGNSNGILEFEPMFTIGDPDSFITKMKSVVLKRVSWLSGRYFKVFDYDKVWRKILKRKNLNNGKVVFKGAFADWDNTPRFGKKSTMFKNVTTGKFYNYLLKQTQKSDLEYIFINAWNEWAEGAYLEPDKKNGTGFLDSVLKISKHISKN